MAELLAIGLRILRFWYEFATDFVFDDFRHFYSNLDAEKYTAKQNNTGATRNRSYTDSATTFTYRTGRPKILRISYGFSRVVGGQALQNC